MEIVDEGETESLGDSEFRVSAGVPAQIGWLLEDVGGGKQCLK